MYSQTNSYALKLVSFNQSYSGSSFYQWVLSYSERGMGFFFLVKLLVSFFIIFLLILINSHQQKLGTEDK